MKYLCDNCSPKIGCTNRFENKKTECDSYVPMNNEQFIRFCDTEQLANTFFEYRYTYATPRQKLWMSANEKCIKTDIVEWLKQPHQMTTK